MDRIRVRFAPSPTGMLHIGGARTALFNWLFARNQQGSFILRIEDTDRERSTNEAVQAIMAGLRWLGLDWDEGPDVGGEHGPYFQSERLDLYQAAASALAQSGAAYPCFCTPEELAAKREQARREGRPPRYDGQCRNLTPEEVEREKANGHRFVLRLRVPQEGQTTVCDLVRGDVTFDNVVIDDFIIIKSDGMPTYNFACVVDDYHMQVTHVLRAEEHLSNTPKQIMVAQALGWESPTFAHVPMILAPDRSKLSKRHGATSVEEFREQGFLPEAIINYLALLGWSPGEDREIMPLEQIVKEFSLERVATTAAIYDVKKLTWINGHYIRALDLERIMAAAEPFINGEPGLVKLIKKDPGGKDRLRAIIAAVRDRVKTLAEIPDAISYFYRDDFAYEEKGYRKYLAQEEALALLQKVYDVLSTVTDFTMENTEAAFRSLIAALDVKGGVLIHPTRVAITGRTFGPGLFDVMALLGKKKTLARLARAINELAN
ncbi:MAG TPA: glutamate--tRNA ligase [Firmicutes bacterium]|nr:glutamate--tRNA ligase [Bacillota bacterium]